MREGAILSEPAAVSPNNQSDTAVWQTRFFWLTGLLIAFRLFLSLYLDLTPDESYYWELSRRLDWSYFDHPPLVAWLIALFRLLPGESALEVRLISIFGSAFVGWCLFVIGKNHLKNPAAGFIAALMVNFTPAGAALGFITTPDTPLAVAWAAGMLAFCRAINDEKPFWWVFTGVALGFGALGKYNMIMFVPGVAVTILGFQRYRHLVATSRYWFMVLLAAAGTLPIIYWNLNHDWISFKFQFDHGLSANTRSFGHNLGEYLGGQLGTVGLTLFPVLWWIVCRQAVQTYRRNDEIRFFLAWLALPTMLFFTWTGLKAKVEANWPQVAYLSAFLLVAEWLSAGIAAGSWRRFKWVAGPSLLLAVVALVQSMTLVLPLPVRSDVTVRMHGWKQMGEFVRRVDAETGRKRLFVVQGTTLTTLVGYYGGIEPERLAELYVNGNFRVWWQGKTLPPGADVVFVDADHYPESANFGGKFTKTASESLDIYSCGRKIRRINITRMDGLLQPHQFIPLKVF